MRVCVCVCVRARARACVCARARACVCARAPARVCVGKGLVLVCPRVSCGAPHRPPALDPTLFVVSEAYRCGDDNVISTQ